MADSVRRERLDGVLCYSDSAALGLVLELLRRGVSGNEVGLSEGEFAALDGGGRAAGRAEARRRLVAAGADVVVDDLRELTTALDRSSS